MKLDIDKKTKFETRLKELLKDGDAIANGLSGIELGEFSQENIQIHKWCTSLVLLLEGTLDNKSLLIEDLKNASKKAKRPKDENNICYQPKRRSSQDNHSPGYCLRAESQRVQGPNGRP